MTAVMSPPARSVRVPLWTGWALWAAAMCCLPFALALPWVRYTSSDSGTHVTAGVFIVSKVLSDFVAASVTGVLGLLFAGVVPALLGFAAAASPPP